MDAVFYGAAVATFVVAAVSYFRGHFHAAFLIGFLYWGLAGRVVVGTMSPGWAWSVLVPLAVLPGGFLVVHAIDARVGYFRLPTVYSIPLAFVLGLMLLFCAGLGVVLA